MTPGFVQTAEGSVLIEVGHTRVLCNATVDTGVPGWMRGSGRGWVTAEYGMLPRATLTRSPRESERGKVGGRTHEIQRLIGRSLRSVVDMKLLGERTVILDCDVIQADGGTRTAAITGACAALAIALGKLVEAGTLKESPLKRAAGWKPCEKWMIDPYSPPPARRNARSITVRSVPPPLISLMRPSTCMCNGDFSSV